MKYLVTPFLVVAQLVMLVLWFTAYPTLPWWVAFLPLLFLGSMWLLIGGFVLLAILIAIVAAGSTR